jgi:hypothetical protein
LRNFIEAIREGGSQDDLNCPAIEGFKTLVTVLKIEEAVRARRTLAFDPKEFEVET